MFNYRLIRNGDYDTPLGVISLEDLEIPVMMAEGVDFILSGVLDEQHQIRGMNLFLPPSVPTEMKNVDTITRVCKAGHLMHWPYQLRPYPRRCPTSLDQNAPASSVQEICNQLFHPGMLVPEI